ncbi:MULTISPECIES: alpha-amylase family protein [unclassified Rathayibacter]|uniref:alpha-amylase family protein n=1 Tax=unclassified Rathayibacter TaxID=2609250 RepID=UPI00188D0D6C|nr:MULTISPECIES: alpha-amylase family protein [unclassified Rathayibacter]MBF4462730.1 alpha-amylase family protein [Rathayibacter sp. VKM Ac-2879]MBF4504144.1 alpha-amylase family protein [Rathayibacter sp. VKM Ac-2878]
MFDSTQLLPPASGPQEAQALLAEVRRRIDAHDDDFAARLDARLPRLVELLSSVYSDRADLAEQLAALVDLAATSWNERSEELRALDRAREQRPDWFLSNKALGGVCYVDRFAGDLEGVRAQIPYFREIGLNYLHLMPLFEAPEGESDGGYAVSSYRRVRPDLGDMEQLRLLASDLRRQGIALVLDFVFNHTSNEHEWAQRALAGEERFEDYYWIFPDREQPDVFERTTREIFPEDHSGSFVPLEDGRWVWATFHRYQWDLNYANPEVFRAMAGEMLFLANQGVEVLRMDAVPFIWKELGTTCESQPEAHLLLRAFNEVCRLAAPSLLFTSEAIVHPDEVIDYLHVEECQLSYNPLQMALTWEALATRDARLLSQALERRHAVPDGTAWVTYVRGHDDIGWTFADEDAAELGIDAAGHRRFLNDFYTDRFEGTFARGVPFQENPRTGDRRVSGTTASLAGLEAGDPYGIERILLAHSIALSTGGLPLLFLGDEVGQLNDYSSRDDPQTAGDSRWINRPRRPVERYAERETPGADAGEVFGGLLRLIAIRKAVPLFAGTALTAFDPLNIHVLGYQRPGEGEALLVLANVSEEVQEVSPERFGGLEPWALDLVTEITVDLREGFRLAPLQFVWLRVTPA